MRARVQGRESSNLKRIEDAQDVELPFLRKVRSVREYGKGDVHRVKVAGARRNQLVYSAVTRSQTHAGFGKTDALLLLMALIWGVNFSVVKFETTVFTPLAFTGMRVMLAAVVLLLFAFARSNPFPRRRDILVLILLGMVGNGLYQLLFVEGLSRTRVANAALIVAATPAFIAIAGRFAGVERVSRRVVAGIALSLAGVGLVVLGSSQAGDNETTFIGTLLVFSGTLCW